jgi:hypothetical protein
VRRWLRYDEALRLQPEGFGLTAFHLSLPTSHFSLLTSYAVLLAKQELLHVREQELLRLGLANVQSVVVDQLLLGLEPLLPADIADLLVNPEPDVILEGPEGKLVAFLATASAEYVRHAGKITRSLIPTADDHSSLSLLQRFNPRAGPKSRSEAEDDSRGAAYQR